MPSPLDNLGNFFSGGINDAQNIQQNAGSQIFSSNIGQDITNALGFSGNTGHILSPESPIAGGIFAINGGTDGFYFFEMEIPEQIPLGGVQVNALHQFPHGPAGEQHVDPISGKTSQVPYRTIDVFGPQPHTLEFSGEIYSIAPGEDNERSDGQPGTTNKYGLGSASPLNNRLVTAVERMQILDSYRLQGSIVRFYYDEYSWEGVITEFSPIVHHVHLVTYTLKFELLAEDINVIKIKSNGFKFSQIEASFSQNLIDLADHVSKLLQGSAYWLSFAEGQLTFLAKNPAAALTNYAYFSPTLGSILNIKDAGAAAYNVLQANWDGNTTITPISQTLTTQTDKSSAIQVANPVTNITKLPTSIVIPQNTAAYQTMSVTDVNNSNTSSASGNLQTYTQILNIFTAVIPQFFNNMYLQFIVDMDSARPISTLSQNSIQGQILPEISGMMTVLKFILRTAADMVIAYNDPSLNSLVMSEGYSALSKLFDLYQLFLHLLVPVNIPTITTNNPDLVMLALQFYGDPDKWILIARANNLTSPTPSGLYTLQIPPDTAGQVNVGNPVLKTIPQLSS